MNKNSAKEVEVMLSERQNKILRLIVERYIKEPIPVGSKVISKELNCSSATVRNEMGENYKESSKINN